MFFPTEINQRIRVSYETGVPYRGESGFVESFADSTKKYVNVKFSDGKVQKINRIYLRVIDKINPEWEKIIFQLEAKIRESISKNPHFGSSISYLSATMFSLRRELGLTLIDIPDDFSLRTDKQHDLNRLFCLEIKEVSIKIHKEVCLKKGREIIWD